MDVLLSPSNNEGIEEVDSPIGLIDGCMGVATELEEFNEVGAMLKKLV